MKLAITSRQIDNVYHVEVALAERDGLSPVEAEAIDTKGEPLVDCGGLIEGEGDLEFTLDSDDRYFPSQFPVKQKFSEDDYENAYERSVAWSNAIKTRIQNGVTSKRALTVRPAGMEIVDLPTFPD